MGELFKFEFNLQELDAIVKALNERPYREVKPLIEKIMNDYTAQSSPPKEASTKAVTE